MAAHSPPPRGRRHRLRSSAPLPRAAPPTARPERELEQERRDAELCGHQGRQLHALCARGDWGALGLALEGTGAGAACAAFDADGRLLLHLLACCRPPPPHALLDRAAGLCPAAARTQDHRGCLPLHLAMLCGRGPEQVAALLRAGPAECCATPDESGRNPLQLGVWGGGPAASVELLLEAGPSAARTKDGSGWTALHLALGCGAALPVVLACLAAHPPAAAARNSTGSTSPGRVWH
jgi:hypothetical protein